MIVKMSARSNARLTHRPGEAYVGWPASGCWSVQGGCWSMRAGCWLVQSGDPSVRLV